MAERVLEVPDDHGFPCEWCGSLQRMMRPKGFQRLRKKRANHLRCIVTRGVVNRYWKFR